LLPVFGIFIVVIAWAILRMTGHRWFKDYKRNVVISIICIMFLLHPTLTKQALTLFQCTDVGNGQSRVTIEMEIE
jgi:hypothetical protein